LAAAPLGSDETRAFLQQRVALFARLWIAILLGFFVIGRLARVHERLMPELSGLIIGVHLSVIASLSAIWIRTRSGQRSERELRTLDVVATVVPILSMASVLRGAPVYLRFDLIVLVAIAHVLMARAVVVPSSPRRTLVIGVLTVVPFAVGTHWHHRHAPSPALPNAWFYTLATIAWGSASIVVSTLASYTIYGLRAKVREAAQLGQYTLEELIGEGGMGIVYRARHAMLRRPTAIKLLPPAKAGEENIVRFEREVQMTSMLTHANTIAIYDYGRTPDGIFYYAMEYLDGIDLEKLVEENGPQTPGCVAHVMEQVCGALAEAHAAALVHRDVKPANVILCERGGVPGVAKVVDFGLVKTVRREDRSDTSLSSVDTVMGTPLYLSPEAIARPASMDGRSDIYSAGCVAYFLLTGHPVFEAGSVVEICGHHLHSAPIPPSERLGRPLPPEIEALVLACLEKDPEKRPQSAADLALAFGGLECRRAFTPAAARAWWKSSKRAASTRARAQEPSATLAIDWQGRKRS
jgi:eukaryotic-like serine/threonine-protein kinase